MITIHLSLKSIKITSAVAMLFFAAARALHGLHVAGRNFPELRDLLSTISSNGKNCIVIKMMPTVENSFTGFIR